MQRSRDTPYLVVTNSGVYYSGNTNSEGFTKRIYRPESDDVEIYIGEEASEKLQEIES